MITAWHTSTLPSRPVCSWDGARTYLPQGPQPKNALATLTPPASNARCPLLAAAHSLASSLAAQRTFCVQMLRCLDVRTAGYTLANVHKDAAPTWRRGQESTQLDHILYRLKGVAPLRVQRSIEWFPTGVTDHALVIGDFPLLPASPLPTSGPTSGAAPPAPLAPPAASDALSETAMAVDGDGAPVAARAVEDAAAATQPSAPPPLTRRGSLSLGLSAVATTSLASLPSLPGLRPTLAGVGRSLTRSVSYLPLPFLTAAAGGEEATHAAPLLGEPPPRAMDPTELARMESTESVASRASVGSIGGMSVQL